MIVIDATMRKQSQSGAAFYLIVIDATMRGWTKKISGGFTEDLQRICQEVDKSDHDGTKKITRQAYARKG